MADIRPFNSKKPIIDDSAWIAPDAVITGDVEIGELSSMFYKTVIRGDVNRIIVGNSTNSTAPALLSKALATTASSSTGFKLQVL